ncbi:MAG: RNA methyltransferase [Actinomycetota bacterium]|nr:RNA methyltransferase [Actinomycetota bacterium]
MITSKHNETLKLIRRLAERKHRLREGLFVTEGEDLYEAGIAAGAAPAAVLSEAGSGLVGEEVPRDLLDSVSAMGSGSRLIAVWPIAVTEAPGSMGCVYLHGLADPGNVGAVIRSTHALAEACVVLGPGCADPHSPKAARASMGSIFATEIVRCGLERTPSPRIALVAHGGDEPQPREGGFTLCLGAEREGLPAGVTDLCDELWTIPLRPGGAESLNVAAAGAIALERIGSAAVEEGRDEHA